MKQKLIRLFSKGLMLLILSNVFISCQQKDKPFLIVDFHGNIFELYFNKKDTIGILKDDKHSILRSGKSHVIFKKNTIYFTLFDYQLVSYDIANQKVLYRIELNNKFNIDIKLRQIDNNFIGLSSDNSMYILDSTLNVIISPLDSMFRGNRKLKETSKPEWYYYVLENRNIQIHIPQFNGQEIVKTFKF
ncbi:hypothetical protein [Flectobacillus major]|uniref:hypothetical protein n=1 Tax=Flectobacillus major TaxID=103 RepID=UPI0005C4390D|nr:hypothetical protein [Flectobacillus major]